jgi:hypothetical protein
VLGGVVGRQPYILGWSPLSTSKRKGVCLYKPDNDPVYYSWFLRL